MLLSCKAYDLEGAITSFASHAAQLPILDERLGGTAGSLAKCLIAVRLKERHDIVGSVRPQGSPP